MLRRNVHEDTSLESSLFKPNYILKKMQAYLKCDFPIEITLIWWSVDAVKNH
jgi:hypothetical protein